MLTHVLRDMDPCHSGSPRSPALTSAATVAHLIRNIEQLKNKDKLISQLEKDLGHQWVAAQFAALERGRCEGGQGTGPGSPSHPPSVLPGGSADPDTFSWTPSSTHTPWDVEDERSAGEEGFAYDKQDLSKKLKDSKERNKELLEKCRAYLQRTKELTAQNRAYKDSNDQVLQEHKKTQELLEHSKLHILKLTRQLCEVKSERTSLVRRTEEVEEMTKQITEGKKTITALKQACSEKDRRIELIQHRKKRRRVIGSAEKTMGVKATFYGYDEDNRSVDSENSFSSLSHSTLSDEDLWDDVMSREETERNYQRLMMEQLGLQKSHALLQQQVGNLQDPQREDQSKNEILHDLFQAQCRIEQLESLVNEIGDGEVKTLLKEREAIILQNRDLFVKAESLNSECHRLQQELNLSHERSEDLEFRLIETEHLQGDVLNSTCQKSPVNPHPAECLFPKEAARIELKLAEANKEMEQIRKELAALLKGKGKEADAVLKKLDKFKDTVKRAESLESMAHELQMKVIALQKDKDSLHDELKRKASKSGKVDSSSSAARERQENMELKAEIAKLTSSEYKLMEELSVSQEQIEDWKTQYEFLKQQLDIVTQDKARQQQLTVKTSENSSGGESSPPSPSQHSSKRTRNMSKDRKSKSRSGDDSTPQTKRRKSSNEYQAIEHASQMKAARSFSDIKSEEERHGLLRSFNSIGDIQTMTEVSSETEEMLQRIRLLENELIELREENASLLDQLKQSVLERSSEAEADQQMLLDRLRSTEAEVNLLRKENVALAEQLRQHVEEFDTSQDGLNPRSAELEDYCEDLEERLHAAEASERHMKESLKLVEGSIQDAESSEIAMREEYEKLKARESEAKKHICELQKTVFELKDIILDKDIVEQALKDKVDFLQRAEAASVLRIEELEVIERDLRQELEEMRSGEGGQCQRELHKIQELKHQITFLETDNKALSARVSELEENEEILRENWRRVADEDFSRTQCLEEKVKILESLNRELKSKLTDAQEYYVINTVPSADLSLASELAQSQSKSLATSSIPESNDEKNENGANQDKLEEEVQPKPEKMLQEKLRKLERKLSDVSEQKNSKIETLQEKIVSLRENEIKLSETIAEMEMTERELRAKVALYESSEVTVEKMLKYQSKIEELKTSQESLLDQLESMESQEMTLQEKMQEMERTLRGKIVTLEVEMKGFKQKELKDAGRIRELEKQEKDLSEKVAQQAEKENGLYIRISSLMDELKTLREETDNLNTQVRRSKLLEVKLLEIEMEFGKKMSSLSSKYRHKEEELRLKESSHEEELKSLREQMSEKVSDHSQQVDVLEKMFAQKEMDIKSTISLLEDKVQELTCERDEYEAQIKELKEQNQKLEEKDSGYEKEFESLREKVSLVKNSEEDHEKETCQLKEDVNKERERAEEAESKVISLQNELSKERQKVLDIESKMVALKKDISEKMKHIESSFVEKETEYEKEQQSLKSELTLKSLRIEDLEKERDEVNDRVRELQSVCDQLKSEKESGVEEFKQRIVVLEQTVEKREKKIYDLELELSDSNKKYEEQTLSLRASCESKESKLSEMRLIIETKNQELKDLEEKKVESDERYNENIMSMKKDREMLENELRNKVMFLNTQLIQEVASREAEQSNLEDREKSFSTEVTGLNKEIEQHKRELIHKLTELETKNKESCELSLELSNVRHVLKTLQNEFDTSKDAWSVMENDLKNQISEKNELLEQGSQNLCVAQAKVSELSAEVSQKDSLLRVAESDKQDVAQKYCEIEKLMEEKIQKEVMVQEQMQKSEHLLQESQQQKMKKDTELDEINLALRDKDLLLEKHLLEKAETEHKHHNSMSAITSLEAKVSGLEEELSDRQKTVEHLEQEILKSDDRQKAKEVEVEALRKELDVKQGEIQDKDHEHEDFRSQILSQMSAKQQELERAQTELQKCLEDIQQYKVNDEEKELKLQQNDQTYKEMTVQKEQLIHRLEEKDHEYKQVESNITSMEHKLVEAENRYRELESKCASLEMQLEARFAQSQEAERIFLNKDQVREELESQLALVEKKCKELEAAATVKDERYELAEAELLTIKEECRSLRTVSSHLHTKVSDFAVQEKESEVKYAAVQSEVQKLENKFEEATIRCEKTETELKESKLRCKDLESEISDFKSHINKQEFENASLLTTISDLEKNCKEDELLLATLQSKVEECQDKFEEKDQKIRKLEEECINCQNMYDTAKYNLEEAKKSLCDKSAQYDVVVKNVQESQLKLGTQEEELCELRAKLAHSDQQLQESVQNVSELTSKIVVIEKALDEKEMFCKDSRVGLDSLEKKHLDAQIESENLKSKLSYVQKCLEMKAAEYEELERKLSAKDSELSHSEESLRENEENYFAVQRELSEKAASLSDSEAKLEHSEKMLVLRQSEVKKLSDEIHVLKENLGQAIATQKDLKSKCVQLDQSVEEREQLCKRQKSQLESVQKQLSDAEEEAAEALLTVKNVEEKLRKSEEQCSDTESKLNSVHNQMEVMENHQEKCVHLESQCSNLKEEQCVKDLVVAELQSKNDDFVSSIGKLEEENSRLNVMVHELNVNVHSSESKLSELTTVNQDLSEKLSQMKEKLEENASYHEEVFAKMELTLIKVKELEDKNHLLEDENASLHLELEEASKEFENLRNGFENSKINIESEVYELSQSKEGLKKDLILLQKQYNEMLSELEESKEELKKKEQEQQVYKSEKIESTVRLKDVLSEKEDISKAASELEEALSQAQEELHELKEVKEKLEFQISDNLYKQVQEEHLVQDLEKKCQSLSFENDELKSKVAKLEEERESLTNSKLDTNNKDEIVDDSDICISVSSSLTTLECVPNLTDGIDNSTKEVTNESLVLKENYLETALKLERAMEEIESYRSADDAHQEELRNLKAYLEDMQEKEDRMLLSMKEMESKEKDLLEQIADVEATVIVPLETENQELMDKLAVVVQERDDALSAPGIWEDKEEDVQLEIETVRKNLEDALFQRDGEEKKVGILTLEVEKLESEKSDLMKKISDLEGSKSETLEAVEALEEEVQRLCGLEKQKTVVEEAETRLMDRVLDLEEREQLLTAELDKMKAQKAEVSGQQSWKNDLEEKLRYLEKKNEMLLDAEGRYMDKLMELEEHKHRLEVELANSKSVSESETMTNTKMLADTADTSDVSPINPLSQVISTCAITLSSPHQETSVSEDSSEQSSGLSQRLNYLRSQNEKLMSDLQEKATKTKYLEEKLVLLEDSEAKLMERLLNNEEMNGRTSEKESELEKKIDNLTEENEFLAESVENYKQLYKDEKEKTNDLQVRMMEDSSAAQELHELQSELRAAQVMVEEMQTEYEEQLSERDEHVSHLKEVIEQSRSHQIQHENILEEPPQSQEYTRVNELEEKVRNLTGVNETLQQKIDSQIHLEENLRTQEKLRVQELQGKIDAFSQRKEELKSQHKLREQQLQGGVDVLSQQVQDLIGQVEGLERQIRDLKTIQDSQEHKDEDPAQSDSGLSADDPRASATSGEKEPESAQRKTSAFPPAIEVLYSSTATLHLSKPATASSALKKSPPTPPPPATNPSTTTSSRLGHGSGAPSMPVAPPRIHRKAKSRQPSIDSITHEELTFLVEDLQEREAALKKRVRELEAISDSDLSQQVVELEAVIQNLERRLKYSDALRVVTAPSPSSSSSSPFSTAAHFTPNEPVPDSSSNNNYSNNSCSNNNKDEKNNSGSRGLDEDNRDLNQNLTPVFSSLSDSMRGTPEDVLHQRIKELEGLDKYNKNQVSELERDREVLHEITRKDKATIHDLNVKIRELQLSDRSLKEQVTALEVSESSLFSQCEELEVKKNQLEDRVHELEIHERRLRELVRKLKLDEEHWLSKSGGMETAVAELSANEQQLKRVLQDVEMERGGLSERAEYLETRIRELENVEASLLQRIKSYEINEVSLQNRLAHVENSEAATQSKASELDMLNMDMSQRLQKAVEENAVLGQHITQLHGQIQELDRRLMSSRDSELAYKQHVESLQKNESSLQKKVREYELREIDSQAKIRELEQTAEISSDKLASLQRSETRLKYRLQELEGVGSQIPGELTPAQRQKMPQKLEDCQKRVVVLQGQVENLQLQLRQALNTTQEELASKVEGDKEEISLSVEDYHQLQSKSALVDETMYQMEEVELMNEGLSDTILQLQQGKGASGHEVEIEVLKRRLASYKTFINKLKSSLSAGQATSLSDPDLDSGPQGDTLPACELHGLASERVLQSVRGLHQGKADPHHGKGAQDFGLPHTENSMVQSTAASSLSSQPLSIDWGDDKGSSDTPKSEHASSREESHWRAIEARKPKTATTGSRGGAPVVVGAVGTSKQSLPPGMQSSATTEMEEVTIGLHLASESELSSHHRTTQNDTDTSCSPVPPPRRGRTMKVTRTFKNENGNNSSSSSNESSTAASAAGAVNSEHFGKGKSLPSPVAWGEDEDLISPTHHHNNHQRPPLKRFAEDSFYLPSSTQEGVDSLDDDDDEGPPPLPASGPPGAHRAQGLSSPVWSSDSGSIPAHAGQERKNSLDNSTSGMSIRERIAMIEKHLQSDTVAASRHEADDVYHWKTKSSESLKQAETLERDNKHLKEEINRLEKELEEKRRYINILELWLTSLEDLLKNKNKQTDREMVEQLQMELAKLRNDLGHVGYRSQDALLDPAALKTELEHRDREIVARRNDIEALTRELKKSQEECQNIEGMRRTALDSIRGLEVEVINLQDKETQLQNTQTELKELKTQTEKTREVYEENLNLRDRVHQSEAELVRLRSLCDDFNNLSARYDEMETYKNQAVNMVQPLQAKLDRLSRKCQERDALLLRLGAELRKGGHRQSSALDDLMRLEQALTLEEYNTEHPDQTNGNLSKPPAGRPNHTRSSSLDELDLGYLHSDSESSTGFPATAVSAKRQRPKPYVSNRPRSAETAGSSSRMHNGPYGLQRMVTRSRRSGGHQQLAGSVVSRGQFVAIADYDPGMFSQSGRPGMELAMREGDCVLVVGPMDQSGYYEALVNGRSGLVPANYLQPLNINGHHIGYPSQMGASGGQVDHTPQELTNMFSQLQPHEALAARSEVLLPNEGPANHPVGQFQHSSHQSLGPDPPHNLRIKGIVNDRSLLLSWIAPKLDIKGNSNGLKVLGYMVYLDNREYEQIADPRVCEIVVEGLSTDHPHHLAVQSLCAGGYVSPRAELIFEGMVKMSQGGSKGHGREDLDTDLSSVLNSAQYKRGHKRTVLALYDYSPDQQSPHDYTALELAFHAGDVIHVYGEPRQDGFYHGEVDGKRGLVPACFVEDVSTRNTVLQKITAGPNHQSSKA